MKSYIKHYVLLFKLFIHSMLYEQKIFCHWSNVKGNNRKNEIESRLKNNNI